MNSDRLLGGWKQLQGYAQEAFGDLLSSRARRDRGRRLRMAGRRQYAYGTGKEAASALKSGAAFAPQDDQGAPELESISG